MLVRTGSRGCSPTTENERLNKMVNEIGARAPTQLSREVWRDLVTTLNRPLEGNEADVIRKAYTSLSGRQLNPGIVASLTFPQIRGGASRDQGFLELDVSLLALNGYANGESDSDITWDVVTSASLIEGEKEV